MPFPPQIAAFNAWSENQLVLATRDPWFDQIVTVRTLDIEGREQEMHTTPRDLMRIAQAAAWRARGEFDRSRIQDE